MLKAQYTHDTMTAVDLDHPEWERAESVRIERYWSGALAPRERQAEARVLWTENELLVHFVCRQGEPLVVSESPRVREKTIGLWDRDVCEIFVAPNAGEPGRYFEFEAAPTGEWLDLALRQTSDGGHETDWQYRSGMTAAARVDAELLTMAMSIPVPALGAQPRVGERWRANLYRCVGAGADRGYLAWQPTLTPQPNFHVPHRFGWLEFMR